MLLSFNHDICIKGWGIVKYFCTAHIFTFYLNIQVKLFDTKKAKQSKVLHRNPKTMRTKIKFVKFMKD